MTFWIASALIAVLGALWIAKPLLRARIMEMNDSEGAISVFRDQLDEVERDHQAGLISAEERHAAQREIEARTLAAARNLDGGVSISKRAPAAAATVAVLAAGFALGGYALVGADGAPDQPLVARKTELLERRAAKGDLNARIALMIQRTEANPERFEDWWTLAVSYASIGDNAAAVEAYRHAAALEPGSPGVQAAYGEAMVLANGNKVPKAARIIFETVLRETPDPRARYYVALAKAQAQEFEAALSDWVALKQESRPEAPWLPLVRRDIVNMVRFLEWDLLTVMPDATDAEIAAAGGASDDEVNTARIAELERKLAGDPMTWEAWLELAERQAHAGENDLAAEALTVGAAHFAGAPFIRAKFDQTARALGLDIRGTANSSGVKGPTAEDVATVTALPKADQEEMIKGMVAGLAAELAEAPDNPDKWIMLVRSYSVLGEQEKAVKAYEAAKAHFEGKEDVLTRLSAEAGAAIDLP